MRLHWRAHETFSLNNLLGLTSAHFWETISSSRVRESSKIRHFPYNFCTSWKPYTFHTTSIHLFYQSLNLDIFCTTFEHHYFSKFKIAHFPYNFHTPFFGKVQIWTLSYIFHTTSIHKLKSVYVLYTFWIQNLYEDVRSFGRGWNEIFYWSNGMI